MIKDIALGVVRHAGTVLAGTLVTHGLATSDQGQQIAGGLVAAAAVAWSAYEKWKGAKA